MKPILTICPPLSLYIHLPWCIKKCPYCDFNSHEARGTLPLDAYAHALLDELDTRLPLIEGRPLVSIFFGGGTPSLFSGELIKMVLQGIQKRLHFSPKIEITLEANPGTVDYIRFKEFRLGGINRLSLGIQSLHPKHLKLLGRIHDNQEASLAILAAKEAGFTNFNLDLMFGLPHQTLDEALNDLKEALTFKPSHLSWYQLTIEPNTIFYKQPPPLPSDDLTADIQNKGQLLLAQHNLKQYEVSAYALPHHICIHNQNYWEFGDYLGLGAGAHSKITDITSSSITRFSQVKQPKDYLNPTKRKALHQTYLNEQDLIFEFMLNALRLTEGVPLFLFRERTGLSTQIIEPQLQKAKEKGLLIDDTTHIRPTTLGKRFLNDLIGLF